MSKSNNRWDVIYETVDEQAHKIVEHNAATNVDWKTALTVKRNHKKICAMSVRPTRVETVSCSACGGYGVIPNHLRKYVRKCPACKGTGRVAK